MREALRRRWLDADERFATARSRSERLKALSDQTACLIDKEIVAARDQAMDEDLRAELVRHGFWSAEVALRGLGALSGHQHSVAVERLLTVLPDLAVRDLLRVARPGSHWPVVALASRLCAMGDPEEACAWLAGERASPATVYAITQAIASFEGALRDRLATVLCALPRYDPDETGPTTYTAEDLAARALAVGGERGLGLLEEAERVIDEVGEPNLWWDSWEPTLDPRIEIAVAFAEAGEHERATRWLERAARLPLPFDQRAELEHLPSMRWVQGVVALARARGAVPAAIEPHWQRAVTLPAEPRLEHLARRLAALPILSEDDRVRWSRELLERPPSIEGTEWWRLLASSDAPVHVRQEAARRWAADVEARARSSPSRGEYADWYELSQRAMPALPAMAALVPNEAVVGLAQALLAWADQHGPDSHGAVGLGAPPTVDRIFSLLARCPEDAVSVAESLAERGDVPLWRFHGWHLVLPEGLRRGVLLRAMRARSRIAAPGRWVGRLCELAKELPVAERAPLLEIAVCISRLIPAEPTGDIAARQRELECLRDVAAVAPPAMQAVVVDELLARAPEDVDQRNWLLHGLVPHLGPELGARVARAMTEVPEGRRLGQSPCWLEAAARVFPEGEWERRLRALLAADAIDPGALHRPFLPPTLRAERRAQALAAAQTFEEHSRWLSWHFEDLDPSERRALLGEALERAATDLASGGDAAETADAALAYLIRVCQPADLAPHAARLVASAAMSVRTEALRLCAQRGDLAQAALYAPGVTDPLALLVYRIRTLESRESIEPLYREHTARVFSYGWVVELLADAGRIDEVAQLAQGGPAEDSSALAAACFPHATAAGQRELRDATLRAARSHPASSSYLWLLPHLSDDQVDELWARDGSAEGLGAFPVSYYRRFGPDALRVVCARAVAELSAALCT